METDKATFSQLAEGTQVSTCLSIEASYPDTTSRALQGIQDATQSLCTTKLYHPVDHLLG
jgi:hypothetical protein